MRVTVCELPVGWIIHPNGEILATTTAESPFVTLDIDVADSAAARAGYPCYVFSNGSDSRCGGATESRGVRAP